ncbi:hypothetical protein [Candidatus Laterigemmans baculatus]|uniref:hypothetical protein n=1 Tax=Candidatus Laterigemmans baculatus TaxID=2770505 RepID=UPI0013D97629|nr:hypothetical protein [Candidatus Laterigemmans baculatus]
MRLTLRTLLAYLDHTLDPADEAALGEKVQQSSLASELVRRIERLLSHPQIDAPSANAVGPTDDANAVAEYLDSTLAAEATAEVERQCIDSDEHLAEVAASHQILTIALGEPAVVPSPLRQRIYAQRPNRESAASSGDAAAADAPLAAGSITPVGPADSGVSDATTRLPQEADLPQEAGPLATKLPVDAKPSRAADLNATLAAATAALRKNRGRPKRNEPQPPLSRTAMAGDRSREALEAMGPFLSGGRPSRIAPWLVSLALTAAFLFVLTRVFEPFARRPAGDAIDQQQLAQEDDLGIVASPAAPPPPPSELPTDASPASESPASESPTSEAPPLPGDAGPDVLEVPATDAAPPLPSDAPLESDEAPPLAPASEAPPVPSDSQPPTADRPASRPADSDVMEVTEGAPPAPVGEPAAAEATSEAPPVPSPRPSPRPSASGSNGEGTELDPSAMLDAAAAEADAAGAIGRIENDGGLLLTQDPQSGIWGRLFTDSDIASGTVLVSSPTFRSLVTLDAGAEITLIGPTAVRVDSRNAEELPAVTVDFGRLLITSIHGPVEILLATPAGSGIVTLSEAGATAAVSVDFRRPSGTDPGVAANSTAVLSLLSAQSDLEWIPLGDDQATPLATGERLRITAAGERRVDVPSSIPAWLDPPEESVSSIEATARSGLVELLATEKPVELALREAVSYRREEVAALAARTLLNLGMPDSYFGPSGVLNRAAQRTYWPELVDALIQFVDRGPQSAAIVARAASELEGEAADEVLRLLQGFSNTQLEEGGDATLVAMLDHPAMSVRALATETLRQITGTSLYFRADYDTPARRSAGIKKWEAKLNRDQIRWTSPSQPAE